MEEQDIVDNIENIDYLLEKDQMSIEIENQKLEIDGFYESKIEFKPTYKLVPGSETYDYKNKPPGWTDRILYKSRGNIVLINEEYGTIEGTNCSDHRPVYAVFKIGLENENKDEGKEDYNSNNSSSTQSKVCAIY
jgi:hypothetical protein